MAKIHKLSYHEAQKIAAGEVVERPANVAKELIENALDAGATTISVFIEDGGKALIRVVDNGCGMSPEDAHTCFEHHATSKITSVDDLETLATFGFRGEALSSIASVSKVTLITNENPANAGIKLVREGNILVDEQSVAAPRGTDFSVRDIFYNVPARLKFLKKRETEFNQIHTLFQAYSLAYPHLHWQFYSEGNTLHNCPPTQNIKQPEEKNNLLDSSAEAREAHSSYDTQSTNGLMQRIEQLFDTRLAQAGIACSYTTKDSSVTISGVITDNTYARYDRSNLFFFVNQRWIKNQPLARALLKGYGNTLPPGRFPAACLFITVKQDEVDINVHPRKEEVLFLHPKVVENALCSMVGTALEQKLSMRLHSTSLFQSFEEQASTSLLKSFQPSLNLPNYSEHDEGQTKQQYPSTNASDFLTAPYQARHEPLFFGQVSQQQGSFNNSAFSQPTVQKGSCATVVPQTTATTSTATYTTEAGFDEPFALESARHLGTEKAPQEDSLTQSQQTFLSDQDAEQTLHSHSILGQLHKTYIMLEHPDGLYMVDQHAAHERIIYERLAQRFEDAATIQLLFPIIVSIGAEHVERLLPHLPLLHQLGIAIEQFSPAEVIIKATPVQAQAIDYAELIRTVIGWLHEYERLDATELARQINEKLRAQIACKAAVKAGDELTREQMEQLLIDLATTPNRFSCPHGRPTGWLLGTYEIEKRFRRKQ